MQQRLADAGLTLITVSVDDMDDIGAVVMFLAEHKARGPNLLINDDVGLGRDWGYEAAPYLILLDRAGKKVKSVASEDHLSIEDLEKLVKELLAR